MSTQRNTDDSIKLVLIVLAIIALGSMLMMLAFPLMGMWGGGMMGGYGMYGGSSVWGIGLSLVWLAVLVGGGYLGYRWLRGGRGRSVDPALDELRVAYARGDLTDEEYEARRTTLERP